MTIEQITLDKVTILILIDGFLQYQKTEQQLQGECHNPYFNRWFSAMKKNEWSRTISIRHNPYFNRWFSAIKSASIFIKKTVHVTILILIDGFLQ